jgi:hypothetical protein
LSYLQAGRDTFPVQRLYQTCGCVDQSRPMGDVQLGFQIVTSGRAGPTFVRYELVYIESGVKLE